MNCRAQASPLPHSGKENITFCRIRPLRESNAGERDEEHEIFGQGRSLDRQERHARSFSLVTFVLAVAVIAAGVLLLLK